MLDYNFFSTYIAAQRDQRKKLFIALGAGFIMLGLVAGFLGVTEFAAHMIQKDIDADRAFIQSPETLERQRLVREKRAELELLTRYLSLVQNAAVDIDKNSRISSGLMEQINTTLPSEVEFSSMTLSNTNISISASAPGWVEAAELQHNLEALGIFSDVHIGVINGTDNTYQFDVQCTLKDAVKDVTEQ